MRIAVNHLTRMSSGFICVAGLEMEGLAHVRPVIRGSQISYRLLRSSGGVFDIGYEVDVGPTTYIGVPPETEDHQFDPAKCRVSAKLPPHQYRQMLEHNAQATLGSIFGSDLKRRDTSCVLKPGRGIRSLGCLTPGSQPELNIDGYGKLRMKLVHDDGEPLNLSVTDIQFYEPKDWNLRRDRVEDAIARLEQAIPVILSVGLTREWNDFHWLQVNNVYFLDT